MNDEFDKLVAAHREDLHQAPRHAKARWHAAIDQAAELERGHAPAPEPRWHPGSFFWGVAVTAALSLGLGLGFLLGGERQALAPPAELVSVAPDTVTIPVSLTRGLQVHLRDSRKAIAALDEATDSTTLVLRIIQQNRMFESVAEQNDAPKIARVLRAFEPILLQLAASDIAPEDATALREQLSFELDVVLTKLARDSSNESHST